METLGINLGFFVAQLLNLLLLGLMLVWGVWLFRYLRRYKYITDQMEWSLRFLAALGIFASSVLLIGRNILGVNLGFFIAQILNFYMLVAVLILWAGIIRLLWANFRGKPVPQEVPTPGVNDQI